MLKRSRDSLPTSLLLVDEGGCLLGHARLTHLDTLPKAAFIESVVVDKELRGRGLGKELMLRTEKYAKLMDFEVIYLSTYDKQGFYEHIGYKVCSNFSAHGKPYDAWKPNVQAIQKLAYSINVKYNSNSGTGEDSLSMNSNNLYHEAIDTSDTNHNKNSSSIQIENVSKYAKKASTNGINKCETSPPSLQSFVSNGEVTSPPTSPPRLSTWSSTSAPPPPPPPLIKTYATTVPRNDNPDGYKENLPKIYMKKCIAQPH